MTKKTATILAHTEPETKAAADALFERIGMSTSTAVNVFLHRAIETGGLPFDTKVDDLDHLTTTKAPGIISMEDLTHEELIKLLDEAEQDVRENGGIPAEEFFEQLRQEYQYV